MSWHEPEEMIKCRVEKLALACSTNNNFTKGFFIARTLWRIAFVLERVSRGCVHLSERQFRLGLKGSFVLAYGLPIWHE